jgi:hypothetical protein
VQFLSRFDGLLLSYSFKKETMGEFYVMLAGFVVDERVNHFGWIVETGITSIHRALTTIATRRPPQARIAPFLLCDDRLCAASPA